MINDLKVKYWNTHHYITYLIIFCTQESGMLPGRVHNEIFNFLDKYLINDQQAQKVFNDILNEFKNQNQNERALFIEDRVEIIALTDDDIVKIHTTFEKIAQELILEKEYMERFKCRLVPSAA